MSLLPEPDDEDTIARLPIDPIDHLAERDPVARLERVIDERHTNLVGKVSALLDQNRRVVGALHEDLTGLDERLDRLIGVIEVPLSEIAILRDAVRDLRDRVSALEARPACALMTRAEA